MPAAIAARKPWRTSTLFRNVDFLWHYDDGVFPTARRAYIRWRHLSPPQLNDSSSANGCGSIGVPDRRLFVPGVAQLTYCSQTKLVKRGENAVAARHTGCVGYLS